MNKIRKYLIHLLGGMTEEYCDRRVDYFIRVERVNAIKSVLFMMERCYGMPADEWCKAVYEYTCDRHKHAEKEYNDYVKETSIFKNIAKKES